MKIEKWLKKNRIKYEINFIGDEEYMVPGQRNYKYKVILRKGKSRYTISFHDSVHNYINMIEPKIEDIVQCLNTEYFEDLVDFAHCYGYSLDPEDYQVTKKIWKACNSEYENLKRLLGDTLFEELKDIIYC